MFLKRVEALVADMGPCCPCQARSSSLDPIFLQPDTVMVTANGTVNGAPVNAAASTAPGLATNAAGAAGALAGWAFTSISRKVRTRLDLHPC